MPLSPYLLKSAIASINNQSLSPLIYYVSDINLIHHLISKIYMKENIVSTRHDIYWCWLMYRNSNNLYRFQMIPMILNTVLMLYRQMTFSVAWPEHWRHYFRRAGVDGDERMADDAFEWRYDSLSWNCSADYNYLMITTMSWPWYARPFRWRLIFYKWLPFYANMQAWWNAWSAAMSSSLLGPCVFTLTDVTDALQGL